MSCTTASAVVRIDFECCVTTCGNLLKSVTGISRPMEQLLRGNFNIAIYDQLLKAV